MDNQEEQALLRSNEPYGYGFRKQVIESIENGQISINQSSKKYGISRTTIQRWMKTMGNLEKKLREMGGKSAQQQINDLRKRVKELEAEKLIYEVALDIVDEEYGVDSRKKFLPESLQNFMKRNKRG